MLTKYIFVEAATPFFFSPYSKGRRIWQKRFSLLSLKSSIFYNSKRFSSLISLSFCCYKKKITTRRDKREYSIFNLSFLLLLLLFMFDDELKKKLKNRRLKMKKYVFNYNLLNEMTCFNWKRRRRRRENWNLIVFRFLFHGL